LLSIAFILFVAGGLGWVCHKLKLPPLLGYLLTGFFAGPNIPVFFELDRESSSFKLFLNVETQEFTPWIRAAALIIILLRAGLHLKWDDLKSIGRPAFFLSFIPLALEVLAVYHLAMILLGFSATEASILSFCIAAVSPAVIVPHMLHLIRSGSGMGKKVPVMILAGASLDDVIALAGFSAMLALAQNLEGLNSLSSTPVSLLLGLVGGYALGYLCFQLSKAKLHALFYTLGYLVICSALMIFEKSAILPFSAVMGIMAFGFAISKHQHDLAHNVGTVLKHIWRPAELLLFVSVGAEVSPQYLIQAGWLGVIIIFIGLLARSVGVWISLLKTHFNHQEKIYCILAYLPKATVQAAIGGIALQMITQNKLTLPNGLAAGEMILALSVMSIAITAPLGAIAVQKATPLLSTIPQNNLDRITG
jgi:NhaP-type Na+/H+ or K+/H+ antiporter